MDLQSIVFNFSEGDGKNKQLLGGNGANLCEMTQPGLNVPPGFVITTEACIAYLENPDKIKSFLAISDESSHSLSQLILREDKGIKFKH